MIDELSGARLLDGYRGSAPADRAALAGILTTLSRSMVTCDRRAEVDVNPLRWNSRHAHASVAAIRVIGDHFDLDWKRG